MSPSLQPPGADLLPVVLDDLHVRRVTFQHHPSFRDSVLAACRKDRQNSLDNCHSYLVACADVTERWDAAKRHELTKIYNARLGIRITASVDARLRQLALIRRRRLSHVLDDVLDAALTARRGPDRATGRAGQHRQQGRHHGRG